MGNLHVASDVLTIQAHTDGEVCSLAFSPDGKLLASGGGDETMNVWDVVTAKPIFTKSQPGIFSSIAFSPDGNRLASACGAQDEAVKIWETLGGNLEIKTSKCDLKELPNIRTIIDDKNDRRRQDCWQIGSDLCFVEFGRPGWCDHLRSSIP